MQSHQSQISRRSLIGSLSIVTLTLAFATSAAERRMPEFKLDLSAPPRDAQNVLSFAPVADKVGPSVVNVYSTRAPRDPGTQIPFFNDPLFERFFGERRSQTPPRPRPQQGLGSGVIVSEDGYIITNNHVVENAEEIRVVLASGKEYEGTVIGTDPPTDIAVVKVEATNLPAITIADSAQIKVGDVVLAIGNPFGVGQTVTMGIVSAIGRAGFGIVDYEDFIQTDASINPGNSGGALTDVAGRLIGINTAIISPTGINQGIGFAVPINMARHITAQIITRGSVERGYLGVSIQPLTPDLAKAFNIKESKGALVADVSEDSPAAEAGLAEGDVIVKFNGEDVNDSRHLRLLVAQTPPDSKARVMVLRDGKERSFTVRLGELPSDQLAMGRDAARGQRGGSRPGASLQGLQLGQITPQARQQYELPNELEGALVTGIQEGSAGERSGIQVGEVITQVNRQDISGVDAAVAAARRNDDDSILLKVWSRGTERYVALQPDTDRNSAPPLRRR